MRGFLSSLLVVLGKGRLENIMPYLLLDLPGHFPTLQKRELAARLCHLYAEVMQTQSWRPNIGINNEALAAQVRQLNTSARREAMLQTNYQSILFSQQFNRPLTPFLAVLRRDAGE